MLCKQLCRMMGVSGGSAPVASRTADEPRMARHTFKSEFESGYVGAMSGDGVIARTAGSNVVGD